MNSNISIVWNLYTITQYISSFLLVIAGDVVSKSMQGIADYRPEIAQRIFNNRSKLSGREDSNLRPSASKTLEITFKYLFVI